MIIIYIW